MIELDEFPIDISFQIQHFRDFLVASWPFLNKLMEIHDWDNNSSFTLEWIKVNWEFLVEQELVGTNKYLKSIELGPRVTSQNAEPSYKVVCEVKEESNLIDRFKKTENYQEEELELIGFLTECDQSFGYYPPFDFVSMGTIDNKKMYVVPFDQCKFFLKPI